MTFASLILEREPMSWGELPAALGDWLRDAGYIAALGLALWSLAFLVQRPAWARKLHWSPRALLFTGAVNGSAFLYTVFGVLLLVQGTLSHTEKTGVGDRTVTVTDYTPLQNFCLSAAGALALFAVVLPIVLDFFGRLRWRRIWALARLSIKEAWSKGVLWICAIIPFIYLYADWYLNPARPEDQLSQRVKIVYFALTLLFVVTAVLLGSFNIPTDVRNQTIHTIVTKPVERYEIVLGRFVGYALMLALEMAALAAFSLVYVTRGMTPQAAEESYTARVPLFASKLEFLGTRQRDQGENVGREWSYRSYISGAGLQPGAAQQYARWLFATVPGALLGLDGPVRMEFTFDIFRTTKGEEKVQGVSCTFALAHGGLDPAVVGARAKQSSQEFAVLLPPRVEKEVTRLTAEEAKNPRGQRKKSEAEIRADAKTAASAKLHAELAGKYGVFQSAGVVVTDYHTQALAVPATLFKKLADDQRASEGDTAALQILVTMEKSSGPQLLGVARRDLYFLAAERSFELNFLKGAVGLWLGACLVLGIALACSTYLSGVISLLTTAFLCGAGLFREYITSLAFGRTVGGGPFEAAHRLANKQGLILELDKNSTGVNILLALDEGYRWYLRRVLSTIPDVTRYDLTSYVAHGFDISWGQVLFADTLLPLLGYLLPCAILAYYLMNSREIANPT